MPNVKSARKRMRQNEKRRLRNRITKSSMKSEIKRVDLAVQTNALDQAEKELPKAVAAIARTGKKHLIHPRKASRLVSRLTKRLNKAKAAAGESKQAQETPAR